MTSRKNNKSLGQIQKYMLFQSNRMEYDKGDNPETVKVTILHLLKYKWNKWEAFE